MLYDIPVRRIDGTETTLADFAGKVLLIVNVASQCGKTPQYDGLETLYSRYRDRGFAVLGFPANEFGEQEPGSNEEIQNFCRSVYGVDFPMFAKIVVKGEGQHPLYRHLIEAEPHAEFPAGKRPANADDSAIHWNFEKFLIDRKGDIAARFAPDMIPENPRIVAAIEAELEPPG